MPRPLKTASHPAAQKESAKAGRSAAPTGPVPSDVAACIARGTLLCRKGQYKAALEAATQGL